MALNSEVDILGEETLDQRRIVAVDAKADTLFQKVVADLLPLQRQQPVFTGHISKLHRLFDQLIGIVGFIEESPHTDTERAEKIFKRNLHQGHHESAADHDQNRR